MKADFDQADRLTRGCAEFRGQLHHGSRVGNLDPQHQAGLRRVLLDLADFGQIVESHQRLVRIELHQGPVVFDRMGIDDLVPDEVLPLLVGQRLDVLVDQPELGNRRHVETGPRSVQRLDDGGIRVRLDGVVGLHAGELLLELFIVPAQHIVIHHEQRRAMFAGQFLELCGVHHQSRSPTRKFLNCHGSERSSDTSAYLSNAFV